MDAHRLGDPPEAKQLLAELGEGRGGTLSLPPLPPATGIVGALNAVAVGAITVAGGLATSCASALDRLLLASPLGERWAAATCEQGVGVGVGLWRTAVAGQSPG